jgi:hypothetical protein
MAGRAPPHACLAPPAGAPRAGGRHAHTAGASINQAGQQAAGCIPPLAPRPAANKTLKQHFPASSKQCEGREAKAAGASFTSPAAATCVYIYIHAHLTAPPTSRRGLSSRGARKDCSPSMPPSKRGRRSKRSPPSRSPKRGVRGLSPRSSLQGNGERQSPGASRVRCSGPAPRGQASQRASPFTETFAGAGIWSGAGASSSEPYRQAPHACRPEP